MRSFLARVRARFSLGANGRSVTLICLTAVVTGGATATAQSLIDSGDVRDNSLRSADLRNRDIRGGDIARGTLSLSLLKDTTVQELIDRTRAGLPVGGVNTPGAQGGSGAQGPPGSNGQNGSNGANGANATYAGPNWGVVDRNTIGSPQIALRAGPTVAPGTGTGAPPFGDGSLGLLVDDPTGAATADEKAAFGNQVDFAGDPVSGLDEVGFRVFTTGENSGSGVNMPNIAFEVDPNITGNASNFSTLVFVPDANSAVNQWSGYIDATDPDEGYWYLTGTAGNNGPSGTPPGTGCNIAAECEFDDVKAALPNATILIAQVGKGRDADWQGAIDGLRINNEVFDFEPFGVITRTP
jgi:hypothetical protein